MRRRTFLTASNEGIDTSNVVTGDICLCNKGTGKLLIVEASKFTVEEYPSTNYSPVGVVVIPGNHNVYGDGSCAVVSLKQMNCNTPDTGSTSNQSMYWGQYNVDISNMTNYGLVYSVGKSGTVYQSVKTTTSSAYLPSDKFSTVQNPYDKDTYFSLGHEDFISYNYLPSPYNEDDSRNPEYYQTASPSSTKNAMSDFDGRGNTDKIIAKRGIKDYTSWKPTYNDEDDYPAASCCDMYYTDGTKQGDWYLPAMGELGYIMPKYNKINKAISTLTSAYGSLVQLYDGYWSSTEDSSSEARMLGS